jgi:hypothetical protein
MLNGTKNANCKQLPINFINIYYFTSLDLSLTKEIPLKLF